MYKTSSSLEKCVGHRV